MEGPVGAGSAGGLVVGDVGTSCLYQDPGISAIGKSHVEVKVTP